MQWIQKFEGIFHVIYLCYMPRTMLKLFYYYLLMICDFGGRFAIFYDFFEVCLKFRDLGANFGCLAGFPGMGGSKFSGIWALKWPFFCDMPPT